MGITLTGAVPELSLNFQHALHLLVGFASRVVYLQQGQQKGKSTFPIQPEQ